MGSSRPSATTWQEAAEQLRQLVPHLETWATEVALRPGTTAQRMARAIASLQGLLGFARHAAQLSIRDFLGSKDRPEVREDKSSAEATRSEDNRQTKHSPPYLCPSRCSPLRPCATAWCVSCLS